MAESPFENGISIDEIILLLEQHRKYINAEHLIALSRLVSSLSSTGMTIATTGDVENISDLRLEINEMVGYIRSLRREMTTRGGANAREIKDMIQSATSLYTMLTKLDSDITNQARLRCVESAVTEAIKTLPVEAQNKFFEVLEEKLSE